MVNIIEFPSPNVLMAIAGVYVIFVIANIVSYWIKRKNPQADTSELFLRIKTFWVIISLIAVSFFLVRQIAIIFWGVVSFLALKEYFSIIPIRLIDRNVLFWGYLSIPLQYYWISVHWYGMFAIFIPVFVFLFLPLRMVGFGNPQGFLRSVSAIQWGVMMMVFCMSHIAALYLFPTNEKNINGPDGLILYLLFLNQFNDAAQYTWGKTLGKRKILPTLSPKKTVEGFLGGVLTTVVFALIFAPLITPFSLPFAVLIGVVIAVAGFVGDIIVSALKRDLRIKDTSQLLPGHGGILDRIDSLMFTAPLYFHIIRFFYY